MKVSAKLRHLRISPRKVRLVADLIRGLDVEVAQNQLKFINKKVADSMLKLLNSAIANAKNNFKLAENNLYISELKVDEGPVLKRWQPRAFGRASAINKRTSHISIILEEKDTNKSQVHLPDRQVKADKSDIKKDKKDKKKIDKNIKIVKSLDEVKELEKQETKLEPKIKKLKEEEYKKEIKDVRREGSDRGKQHLDTVRKKSKGGALKKMFRRKSI